MNLAIVAWRAQRPRSARSRKAASDDLTLRDLETRPIIKLLDEIPAIAARRSFCARPTSLHRLDSYAGGAGPAAKK